MVTIFQPVSGKETAIHVGQTGVLFHFEIAPVGAWFDLTGATRLEGKFVSPSGTTKTLSLDVVGSDTAGISRTFEDHMGNDSVLRVQLDAVVTDSDFFDENGTWRTWAEVEKTGEYNHRGKASELYIFSVGQI